MMIWTSGSACLLSFLCSDLAKQWWEREQVGIVELGCGTGLVSAGLALFLQQHHHHQNFKILATDAFPTAVHNAAETLLANNLPLDIAKAVQYNWSQPFPISSLLKNVDLVVAAEIIYPTTSPTSLLSLFSHIANWLSSTSSRLPRPKFVVSYVQRNPETTLNLVHAAYEAGLSGEKVDWTEYTKEQPGMEASVLLFQLRREEEEKTEEEMVQTMFPKLRGELESVKRTEKMLAEEAANFVLPTLSDSDSSSDSEHE